MTATPRRFLVPEVVQTSTMDCGPACLTALLSGFDVRADYARLRDACQTDVDGTSIDTLEELAKAHGLDAEQVMLPRAHVLRPEARALPAVAVARLPSGAPHFVVLWRRVGGFVQVMDPGHGRSWKRLPALERELYIHAQPIDPEDYRRWFSGEQSLAILRAQLRALGASTERARALVAAALGARTWSACARLDAAASMVAELVRAGGVRRGAGAVELVAALAPEGGPAIPDRHFAALPGPDGDVLLRGVVLVRVGGRKPVEEAAARTAASPGRPTAPSPGGAAHPAGELWRVVRAEPRAALWTMAGLVLFSSCALLLESLALRGLLAVSGELGSSRLRAAAFAVLVALLFVMLVYDVALRSLVVDLGRRLEVRLRTTFLERLPLLPDRYFRTRLTSDFAHRAHATHQLRTLPELLLMLARTWTDIVLLGVALVVLSPAHAGLVLLAVLAALGVPVLAQPRLRDLDMRARVHSGNLSQFFLDALLGGAPIRAHGAERATKTEHEAMLCQWFAASRAHGATRVAVDATIYVLTTAPLAVLLALELSKGRADGSELLLVYWALILPQRASISAQALAALPGLRNVALRLAEPLASAELTAPGPEGPTSPAAEPDARGVAIALEAVDVELAGHRILEEVDLDVPAGCHVAVVGPSGAGKTTLLGLLLGWHEPTRGAVRVDGEALDRSCLTRLRRETAWVDPSVHLWSESLLANLQYGATSDDPGELGAAVELAEVQGVVKTLPSGLLSPLGEGGRLLSGGQGQRVRVGRAMVRGDARLVLLDEPFRGLDADARRQLLGTARKRWSAATLVYVTHDVSHALDLDLVVVVESGRFVERGAPRELAADPTSRFSAMLRAERQARDRLWGDATWRRLFLARSGLREVSDD